MFVVFRDNAVKYNRPVISSRFGCHLTTGSALREAAQVRASVSAAAVIRIWIIFASLDCATLLAPTQILNNEPIET